LNHIDSTVVTGVGVVVVVVVVLEILAVVVVVILLLDLPEKNLSRSAANLQK
jgi:hypothetical protein